MQKTVKARPAPRRAYFAPRAMGIVVLGIIALAFAAGAIAREIGLALAGAVFLAIWGYCLLATLLLALIHSRRARRASIRIIPGEIDAGALAEALYFEGDSAAHSARIFQMPGILVRCRLLLATRDGRRAGLDFSPAAPGPHSFPVEKRGAYFSGFDEFAVFDALGFFRFAFRLPPESGGGRENARLLAKPHPAGEPPPVNARAGESNRNPEFSPRRSDILIDHRPYVPGDDPRRINWKLYGHGGSLFVREGEREPPPHSNLSILIDAEYDPALYDESEARRGIDLLCETALAAAIACAESGMGVLVGCLDGAAPGGGASPMSPEFAKALARPAARPMREAGAEAGADSRDAHLPPSERGILVMALPRSRDGAALDAFLKKAAGEKARPVDLLFVCQRGCRRGGAAASAKSAGAGEAPSRRESERLAAAGLCTSLFSRRPGVSARMVREAPIDQP